MLLKPALQRQLKTAFQFEPSGVPDFAQPRRANVVQRVGKNLIVT